MEFLSFNQAQQSHTTETAELRKMLEHVVNECLAFSLYGVSVFQSGPPVPHNGDGRAAEGIGEWEDQHPSHPAGTGTKGKTVKDCRLLQPQWWHTTPVLRPFFSDAFPIFPNEPFTKSYPLFETSFVWLLQGKKRGFTVLPTMSTQFVSSLYQECTFLDVLIQGLVYFCIVGVNGKVVISSLSLYQVCTFIYVPGLMDFCTVDLNGRVVICSLSSAHWQKALQLLSNSV